MKEIPIQQVKAGMVYRIKSKRFLAISDAIHKGDKVSIPAYDEAGNGGTRTYILNFVSHVLVE